MNIKCGCQSEYDCECSLNENSKASKSAVMPGSTPAGRMANILLEERQLARAQMADELRAFVAACGPLVEGRLLAYINLLEKEA